MKKGILSAFVLLCILASVRAQQVTRAEYFFNSDPGFGLATSVTITAGDSVNATTAIPIPAGLNAGINVLFVRVADNNNVWSMPEVKLIWISGASAAVSGMEYFFNTDPGFGLATPITISTAADSVSVIQNIPVPSLSIGAHKLYVRSKNAEGTWSFPEVYTMNICTAYGPESLFTHYINGNEVFYTDSSTNSVSRKWLFGDNTTDTSSNPRHVYATGADYTVKLISYNSCGNDTLTKTVSVSGIQSITPAIAPATGMYIGYIKGVGFKSGSTVSWSKSGSPTINADSTIFIDSTSLKVLFKNMNEELGKYTLLVNVPVSGQLTLDSAIQIDPPTPSDLWVRLEGRREVLINRWATYQVVFGNNGNQAAMGVPILIKLPKHVQAKIINPFNDEHVLPGVLPEIPEGRFYMAEDTVLNDSLLVGYFLVPVLEPGMSVSLTLEVKSTTADPFVIRTNIGNPLYNDTTFITGRPSDVNWTFCEPPPCIKCILDIAGLTPAGCVTSIYNFMCSADKAWDDANNGGTSCSSNLLDMTGNFGGMVLSCFSGGATQAIKTASDIVNDGTGLFGAFGSCSDCYKNPPDLDTIFTRFSWDPNVKTGPGGYNTARYTRSPEPFNYSIHFENLASATAPVSEVYITDYLDTAKLDINSVRFTGFGFADTTVRFSNPDSLFIRDVDLRPAKNSIVRVTGKLDSLNKLSFRFITFDPATMSLTTSIDDGFLDPDTNGRRGLGYVSFTVNPKSDLVTGDIINNSATIIFDNNPPISTPVWSNGIDKQKPVSNVLPITERLNDTTYRIHWTGADAHAGIFSYQIMMSRNDSAYRQWIVTDSTAANFVVSPSSIYKFYSVATDYIGNIEDVSGEPDQTLTVTLPVTLLEFNAYKQNKTVLLRWKTSSEQDNRGFEIQRSGDGTRFTPIGWVDGSNNAASITHYSFTDSIPLAGKNFYRLKQLDIDNRFKLSETRKIDIEQLVEFSVFPNPASGELNLQSSSTLTSIRITDLQGRLLFEKQSPGLLQLRIPIQHLPNGLFFLEVTDHNGNREVQKFIKAAN